MAPRALLPLFFAFTVLLCTTPALSATKSSSKSSSHTHSISHTKASSRTASSSRTATRTHTMPRVHTAAVNSGASGPSLASGSDTSATPSLSLSGSDSVTPTFSPTFFLSRCSKVTLSTFFAADCAGVASTLGIASGCNTLTAGANTLNLLYAINNGLPTVAIFESTDTSCGNVPRASYSGALDTCVNQGTTSFTLTCAVVASQTPSPSPSTIIQRFNGTGILQLSTTLSPSASPSPSQSAAPNVGLCAGAVVRIFSSSDCSGFPNVLGDGAGVTQLPLGTIQADGTLASALETCGSTTHFLGRDYFAVYTNVRGTPSVTLYADGTTCRNAVNAVNWRAPNAAPFVGLVAGTNYGGKAQYSGAFNTCVRSATGSYTIGCVSAPAGVSVSATPAAAVATPSHSPSSKGNQCSSVTVSLYSYAGGATVSCTDATKLFLSYSIPLYTCTPASVAGYTALAIPKITSTSPLVYSSTELDVYYYTDVTSCAADLNLLDTQGISPANSVSATITSPISKADADALAIYLNNAVNTCEQLPALGYWVFHDDTPVVKYYTSQAACTGDLNINRRLAAAARKLDTYTAPTSFLLYTSVPATAAAIGSCADLTETYSGKNLAGIAVKYDCNAYAPSATPAPSATAVPHPALCASLAVLTFPASDTTCATAPVTLNFPYVPVQVDANTGIESPINPFSSSPHTTKCLSTTLLGVITYYTITIPAISTWTAASVTYSTYAPVVTLYGADATCGVKGRTYDLALIDNGLGGILAAPNGKAWGTVGPDGKTNLCYGYTNTGSAEGSFTSHYQITCGGVIPPSATPSPFPSACSGDVIVSVYYAGNTITLTGVGTEGGVDTCRPQPYVKGAVTYASNYIGNFTVPATCGPVTYSSAFPSVVRLDDLSLATGTYLAPNLYGSVDYSSASGPAVSLFGGTTPTNWGYQPDNYCVAGLTSKGTVAVITQTLGAAAADGAACTTYTTGTAVQWTNAQAAVPTYYYTYTCASQASATPTPSASSTATISASPFHRLRRA